MTRQGLPKLVLESVALFPRGASVDELLIHLNPPPSRRSLQYCLTSLITSGELIVEGKTKGRRYHLPNSSLGVKPLALDKIPLSTVAESIQSHISKPLNSRPPVQYSREFLEGYIPNETFYLSDFQRQHLFQLGKTDGQRPAGTYARKIMNRLLIDLSWNSSRLEGNTYSLLETERLISQGKAAEGKNNEETQMILNHKFAIEYLVESAKDLAINRFTIMNIHALLADNLLKSKACGSLRSIGVGIGGSSYRPLAMPQLIQEYFDKIVHLASQIHNPFEQSFFLMVHLPYLQPFEDVNKRVSRLSANIPLIRENLCPLSFVGVPEQIYINGLLGIYELNRIELMREIYIWAYERSCSIYSTTRETLGAPDPFRLLYRTAIFELVADIVRQGKNKSLAVALIRQKMNENIPKNDQLRFMEIVETELTSLHKGNIARYRIPSSSFDAWLQNWEK